MRLDIFRLENGVYSCINNSHNKNKYILKEEKGYYPILVPIVEEQLKMEFKKNELTVLAVAVE